VRLLSSQRRLFGGGMEGAFCLTTAVMTVTMVWLKCGLLCSMSVNQFVVSKWCHTTSTDF